MTRENTSIAREQVHAALGTVPYPGMTRDLVSFGMVHDVRVCGTQVQVQLAIRSPRAETVKELRRTIFESLTGLGASTVDVTIVAPTPTSLPVKQGVPDPWADQVRLAAVRHVIAVGAGKGGVGKSTVAVSLALALAADGLRIGLLDADIYGPSLPILLGLEDGAGRVRMSPEKHILPLDAHGIPFISFGFFLGEGSPAIWRGPMVSKAVKQFARGVAWPELDILVVDLPPGTGDIPLSLAQAVHLSGALVVTQPPRVAAAEARKAVEMFRALEVPVLGIVENMTGAFGATAGAEVSSSLGVPYLGAVPFDAAVVSDGDAGVPAIVGRPESETVRAVDAIAATVAAALGWQRVAAGA